MEKIRDVIELVIDKYNNYRVGVIIAAIVISLIFTAAIVKLFTGKRKLVIRKLSYEIFYAAIDICMGIFLRMVNVSPNITYPYFNSVFLPVGVILIVLAEAFQGVIYKKAKAPLIQACKLIRFVIFIELFLLAITDSLTLIGFFALVSVLTGIKIIILSEKYIKTDKKQDNQEEEYDNPSSDLYPTRITQLRKFEDILQEHKKEPYAIMISAEWGMGKTSFVKALEEKLKEDKFLWIRAGSEKTVSEIMQEISDRILEILDECNIFIEDGTLIKQYFSAFSSMLKEGGLNIWNDILGIFTKETKIDKLEYLNNKLNDIGCTIYIIIDDLDRCSEEYQKKMFTVIRESTNLKNCKTIFLVDKSKFKIGDSNDEHYMEKYISYTLYLCEVSYEEIMIRHKNILYQQVAAMNTKLSKGRSTEDIMEAIYRFPLDVSVEFMKNRIEKTADEIRRNIINSRKVKHYLRGIKGDIKNIEKEIGQNKGELLSADWMRAIIEAEAIKAFLPQKYNDIKMHKDFLTFENEERNFAKIFFRSILAGGEKQRLVLDYIIYRLSDYDSGDVKTKKDKYLEELRSGKAQVNNIDEYTMYAETYEDLYKILDLWSNKSKISIGYAANAIFEALSRYSTPFNANTEDFLAFSKKLVQCIKSYDTSEETTYVCEKGGQDIIRIALIRNIGIFTNILLILFDIEQYKNLFRGVQTAYDFKRGLMKLDKDNKYGDKKTYKSVISSIRDYYCNFQRELEKDEYKCIYRELKNTFLKIETVLSICEFWENVNDDSSIPKDSIEYEYYYYFGGLGEYSFTDKENGKVEDLKKALEAFNDFYKTHRDNQYLQNLLRMSADIVVIYETSPGWFGGAEKEINTLLKEACTNIDNWNEEGEEDTIVKIKIYAYKFDHYCSKGASTESQTVQTV